jgi:hypothetical protein
VQESGSAYKTSGTSLKILNSHGDLLLELTKEGSVCAILVAPLNMKQKFGGIFPNLGYVSAIKPNFFIYISLQRK